MMEYIPQVTEGVYPEDAGWTNQQDGPNILLLCIPQFDYLFTFKIKSYDYAWLYNQELDAYIFCFKINDKSEQAVIFKKDHAGILLQDDFAFHSFTVAITIKDFESLREKDRVFMLDNIHINRSEIAGW